MAHSPAPSFDRVPSDQDQPPAAPPPQSTPFLSAAVPAAARTSAKTTTPPLTKSIKKADSNSFSFSSSSAASTTTASSSPDTNPPPHTAIQIHGNGGSPPQPPPAPAPASTKPTQKAAHAAHAAHALPIKDVVYKIPAPLPEDHPSKLAEKRCHRRCSPCARRFACLASLLLTLILVLAIAILLVYLIAHPRLPKIDIQSLTVPNLNITDSSASQVNSRAANYAGYVSAAMVMRLTLRNVNKKLGVRYEGLKGQVWYEGIMISQASIEASRFYQSARNTTGVQVEMHADMVGLNKKEASSMKKSLTANATLALQVSTSANVSLRLGGLNFRQVSLNVTCTVHVREPSTSALVPESCVASHPFLLLLPSK